MARDSSFVHRRTDIKRSGSKKRLVVDTFSMRKENGDESRLILAWHEVYDALETPEPWVRRQIFQKYTPKSGRVTR